MEYFLIFKSSETSLSSQSYWFVLVHAKFMVSLKNVLENITNKNILFEIDLRGQKFISCFFPNPLCASNLDLDEILSA